MVTQRDIVLVVDDVRITRVVISRLLGSEGYEVVTAGTGRQALDVVAERDVNLALLDLRLPDMLGTELIAPMRESVPDIQIVVFTAHATIESAIDAMRGGACAYVQKPVKADEVRTVVRDALEKQRLARENRRLLGAAHAELEQRRLAEASLKRQTRRLQQTVEKLRRTREQLTREERFAALGKMASGIAHEFNNSLAPILGFSDMLLKRPAVAENPAKRTRFLTSICTAAHDAAHSVQSLREFYRPHQDTGALQPVDLVEIVRTTLKLAKPQWHHATRNQGAVPIEIRTDFADVPTFAGDAGELRQAVTNLVFNAADAMPDGGTLTLRVAEEGGDPVLQVSDSGVGMSAEVQARCLTPFFSTKGEKGSGLGLALVYGTVRRHGGGVDIDSKEGRGTTFTLRFPSQSCPKARVDETEAAEAAPWPERARVLLVEGDSRVRDTLFEYLAQDGHSAAAAASAGEALVELRAHEFDLAFVANDLPDMAATDLAARMKGLRPGLSVALLRGTESFSATLETPPGLDAVLDKPVTLDALRAAMHGTMNAAR